MTRDPRPYNGLHLPGGINGRLPTQEELQQLAFAQRQAIAREIYVRAAVELIVTLRDEVVHEDALSLQGQTLSKQCQILSSAYFEGAGLVRPKADDSAE